MIRLRFSAVLLLAAAPLVAQTTGIHAAIAPLPNADAGVVTYVPSAPNELPIGTLLKVRLTQTISSRNTLIGTPFVATVESPIERDGKVVIPAGSELHGTVTDVHGGARFFGRPSLLLHPSQILLPDGSHYVVHAQVIDTDEHKITQVSSTGAVIGTDHARSTLAVFSLTTGSAAAAGAMLGGVPGALIGGAAGVSITTAHWLRQQRQTQLPVECNVVFSLTTSMPMIPLR
jgi:hypothetical protein